MRIMNKGLWAGVILAAFAGGLGAAALAQGAAKTAVARPPLMQLQRQYSGPLKDTVIQRWRDPADGTICYIYLPIIAPNGPSGSAGLVQYGPNVIGAISCFPDRR